MDYELQLAELSEELYKDSKEYYTACTKYAEHYYNFQKLLGLRIMRMANKKPAIEKIVCEALADEREKDFKDFNLHYKGYLYYKALKEGLESKMSALQIKITSIQSTMKWSGKLDSYGNVC